MPEQRRRSEYLPDEAQYNAGYPGDGTRLVADDRHHLFLTGRAGCVHRRLSEHDRSVEDDGGGWLGDHHCSSWRWPIAGLLGSVVRRWTCRVCWGWTGWTRPTWKTVRNMIKYCINLH